MRILEALQGHASKDAAHLVATQRGQDLVIRFADGTEVVLEGFFATCADQACSVTLASDEASGYTISADRPVEGDAAPVSESTEGAAAQEPLVYAYGDHDRLMALVAGDEGMSRAIGDLGEGMVSWVPADHPAGAGLPFMTLLGGGALLLTGGSGVAPEPVNNAVLLKVVGGPVLEGNDLQAMVYAADGTTELGSCTLLADGTVEIAVSDYSGVVVVKVINTGTAPDYFDEALNAPMDLGDTVLWSMGEIVVQNSVVYLNVNVLTSLAYLKAAELAPGGALDAATLTAVDTALSDSLHLDSLLYGAVDPIVDSQGALDGSNAYGDLLAALSGADAVNGGTTHTLSQLLSQVSITGAVAELSPVFQEQLLLGAAQVDPSNALQLVDAVSDALRTMSTALDIGDIAQANVLNLADQQAGVSITGHCEPGAAVSLTLAGQTVAATVDINGNWSYTLTEADYLRMGQGAETVVATATLDTAVATASRSFMIDTLAPTAPTVDALTTNNTLPMLTGTARLGAGETLSVTVNGATYTVTPAQNGDWNLDLGTATPSSGTLGAFTDGRYGVVVTATDAAGNATSDTSSNEIVIQSYTPIAPIELSAIASGVLLLTVRRAVTGAVIRSQQPVTSTEMA